MPFGKYRLRSPGVTSSLGKAKNRYNRLCSDVEVIQKADPEKLKQIRQRQKKKNQEIKENQIKNEIRFKKN